MIPLVEALGQSSTNRQPPTRRPKFKNKVFLAYDHEDKEMVSLLYQRLVEQGYSPWMDRYDLLGGEYWRTRIERAIREADFFVVCLSRNSLKRGFLQKELKDALEILQEKLSIDIYLIPLRLEDCQVPETLSGFVWIDFFEADGWDKLLQSLMVGMERREEGFESEDSPLRTGAMHTQSLPLFSRNLTAFETTRNELPLVTFPDLLESLLQWICPKAFRSMDQDLKRFLTTIGTKLEPIVQIIPATPVPVVIGFECLALGSSGENFAQICRRASCIDPSDLRLLMALAAMKTAETLRVWATENGKFGARHLHFSINLDPEMITSPHIGEFLSRYRHLWDRQIVFEVSEKTPALCLRQLRELQEDYKLRYAADDYNAWCRGSKIGLQKHVELSKVDYATFRR